MPSQRPGPSGAVSYTHLKWNQHRDIWYEDLMKVAGSACAPKEMGAEEALFILYLSLIHI